MKVTTAQQGYVAYNVYSLAQAWLCSDTARPYAIYAGELPVGFAMLDWDEGKRSVGLWRFMFAAEHQHKGYGKAAIRLIIDMVNRADKFDFMYLDYTEGNTAARQLYASFGFAENGEVEDGEIIMILPLTDNPKLGMLLADTDDMDDFAELLGDIDIINESGISRSDLPELEKAVQCDKVCCKKGSLKLFYRLLNHAEKSPVPLFD